MEEEKKYDTPASGDELPEESGMQTGEENSGNEGAGSPEPPEIPEEIRTEKKWADALGMKYDEQEVMRDGVPTPDVVSDGAGEPQPDESRGPGRVPPMYVMPADEPLPEGFPGTREPMPPTYMVWAVLSTVCCCLPLGVVAILFSAQVSTRYYARDYEGARTASRRAEIWIIASIVMGVVGTILYLPLTLISSLLTGA